MSQNKSGCQHVKVDIKVHNEHSRSGLGFTPWLVIWLACNKLHLETLNPRTQADFPGHGDLIHVLALHSWRRCIHEFLAEEG